MFYKSFIYHLLFILLFMVGEFSYSESLNEECDDFDVNYNENEFLTNREQIQAMDDALLESLNKFEECIKTKSTARKNNSNDSIENNTSNGSRELRGNKLGINQESISSTDAQNESQNLESELVDSLNKSNTGSNGKIPEDIPIDNNDDVLAQQIKNAALKERDLEKQKKIWNEYRKYKNLPIED